MKLYLRILRYLRPHRGVLTIAVLSILAFSALDAFSFALLIPFLGALFHGEGQSGAAVAGAGAEPGLLDSILEGTVGRLVELSGTPQEAIRGIIVFILAVFALKNLFAFAQVYLVARVEQGVTRDLRDEVYDHLLDLDLAFFGRTRTGQIISRLTFDVEQLRRLVTQEATKLVSNTFAFLGSLGLMLLISVKLTLAAFIVVPAAMGVAGPMLKRLRKGDRRVLDLAGDISSHLQETLTGIRLVKASAAEAHERRRFADLTAEYFTTYVRTERFRALVPPLTEMLTALGTVVLLWYGSRLVLVDQELTGEAFIVFLGLSLKLYSPVKFMSKFPTAIQPGLVAGERVFEFLDAPIEIHDRAGALEFPGLERSIRFDDVSFEYRPGEPVLRNVTFEAPAGSVTALVGPSGAGKTTLVDLLGRFYDVTRGAVRIDGRDIRDYSLASLRANLGIVSQETVLFHDTIRANIAYGCGDVSAEAIEAAARAAHAHDFVVALPRGYDTVVGERGTQLSGGQRQRVAIARAILRDPPILIFDEATSALDTESERLVQQAIDRLLRGRTVFVIAHRLSTVQRSDHILVLKDGRIVERGRHAELLERDGLYRRLYELQFRDATDEEGGEEPASEHDVQLPEMLGSG